MVKKIESTTRLNNLKEKIARGHIQAVFSKGDDDSSVECQMLIVKRYGNFYLIEVDGYQRATTGLMNFDPNTSQWQEVRIQMDPQVSRWGVFKVRVVADSYEMATLENMMKFYCQ
jgi:hypothetical protein